ncbi:SDR family NAD(P)-dependent oxidoreductase [Bradyrhizobium canariense]|uniref:3-oxoacyl-[acyl-carrier protein] reductase n=1 Tax=Bradyrhizobium canariense TaxID=255045 RepID=A0A1H1NGL3_9BRAD|nr:SDR family oxidoreductase [Bradyrhizobium canariense]SDR97469.1 3-oxoacyl-[acyl-carrier protein] reductase [Bradyrhizobium canariense]
MNDEFSGKVALVTGASKGIGAGIAKALGQAGGHVAVAYGRDEAGARRVVAEIEAAGGHALALQGDLTRTADIEAMVARTVAAFGPIHILVNNAGVFEYKALAEITEAHVRSIFDTNVLGLLMMTKIAIANFDPAGGSVINISSLSAAGNGAGQAVYASSKAAVNTITKVLALELAGRKIRVNAIMPGYYDTEGARSFGMPGSEAEARLMAATPLEKRAGRPSDLSPVALFLASAASSWMTGEILTVSGGLR